jgi:hypothetical protein
MLKRVIAAGATFAFLSTSAWAQVSQSYENPPQPCGIPTYIVAKSLTQNFTLPALALALLGV